MTDKPGNGQKQRCYAPQDVLLALFAATTDRWPSTHQRALVSSLAVTVQKQDREEVLALGSGGMCLCSLLGLHSLVPGSTVFPPIRRMRVTGFLLTENKFLWVGEAWEPTGEA